MRNPARFPRPLILIVAAFLLMWIFLSGELYPSWDAAFYYTYARSAAFDGDLKIDNDLQLSYPTASIDFVNKGYDQIKTETGRVVSPFAIGSSLVWLPWLTIMRGIAAVGQWINLLPQHLSGFEWYFSLGASALSALLGLLAFWLGYLTAYPETSKYSALTAALTLMVASPLIYYQFREPLYSHATSAFVNGLIVYLWWRSNRRDPSYKRALLLGGTIGLAALVRWQNIVYGILPLVTATWWWLDLPSSRRRLEWKRSIIYCALIGLAALAVLSIQFSHWRLLYGNWITVPQGGTFMDWAAPFWIQTLFSPFRGLLPWMPVAFLAILGLVLMIRRRSRLVVPLLMLLVLALYVNGSTRDWFGGGGYGPRRFSSELAIFIIGYSGLIQTIPEKARKPTAIILGVVLFLHQWILLRFGLEERIGGRVVSMSPDFQWSEVSYGEMVKSITGHLPDFINSPRDTFVMYRSPVAELLDGRWPGRQLYVLLWAAIFIFLSWLAYRYIRDRNQGSEVIYWLITIIVMMLIVIANIWILNWA